jgi:hypothetical protein
MAKGEEHINKDSEYDDTVHVYTGLALAGLATLSNAHSDAELGAKAVRLAKAAANALYQDKHNQMGGHVPMPGPQIPLFSTREIKNGG